MDQPVVDNTVQDTNLAPEQREHQTDEATLLRLNINREKLTDLFYKLEDKIQDVIINYYAAKQGQENTDIGLQILTDGITAMIPGFAIFSAIDLGIKEIINVVQKSKYKDQEEEMIKKLDELFEERITEINSNPYLIF